MSTRRDELMPRFLIAFVAVYASQFCIGVATSAAEFPRSAQTTKKVDYLRDVKPVLARHCVSCHGAAKARGGLRLDSAKGIRKGGKEGPTLVPGKSHESLLIAAVLGEGSTDRMPLDRPPLSPDEIGALRLWIDQGAIAPQAESSVANAARSHWAFIPPHRPEVPRTNTSTLPSNAIDRFILSRLEARGLSPSAMADRVTLLRRVSLDLTGLPPTPAEYRAFCRDTRPEAYERVIDRLLSSPHYGERWGRLWLDQARYADSNGFNIDAPRSIWKYRDWVIGALNQDMPFDQFVIDQIAGDLRPHATIDQRVATGFHRNTQINQEGGIDVEQFRIESVADRVNTTGTVFLGLTIGCAQCHDHKYDPISQREYYQLFAFFNNADEPDLEIAAPAALAVRDRVRAEINGFHRELATRFPDLETREERWEATVDLAFKQAQGAVARVAFDLPRDKRSAEQRRALVELMLTHDSSFKNEHAKLSSLQTREPTFVTTMVVQERARNPRVTHVHLGGDFTRKGDRVKPGVPAALPALEETHTGSSGDRMDLAKWLVDRRNPLTARVAVNRIWRAAFGRGIVETDEDFGTQGSAPSHPELLDWLACELMERDWSLKHIHRLIVTSATYRQSSRAQREGTAIDPDNRLLWRQGRLRLDAELIRDSALFCSGLLSRRVGGPSVFPPQPDGVMTLGQMKREWKAEIGPNRYRRGLYTFFWRATPFPFLTTFDAPGGVQACTRRLRSNTPLQALTLLNDPAMVETARGLADRIIRERPDPAGDRARIDHAFELCLGRPPTDAELAAVERLLDQEFEESREKGSCGGELQETGAWMALARVLLNLDEFVTRE
jgi:hypothetical protein